MRTRESIRIQHRSRAGASKVKVDAEHADCIHRSMYAGSQQPQRLFELGLFCLWEDRRTALPSA